MGIHILHQGKRPHPSLEAVLPVKDEFNKLLTHLVCSSAPPAGPASIRLDMKALCNEDHQIMAAPDRVL